MNIVVTSTVVKKVPVERQFLFLKWKSSKHRYFFYIKNNGDKPFEGYATITLYNGKGWSLAEKTFKTTGPIEPSTNDPFVQASFGKPISLDINTGPTSIHGQYGITHFEYVIMVDKTVVVMGEDRISDKYEDLEQMFR